MGNTGRAPHSHIPLNEPCVQTCRVQAAKRRDSLSPDGTTEVAAQVKCGTMDRCVIAMQLKTATPDLPGQTASQPRPKGFSTGKPPKLRLSLTRSSIFEPSSSFPPQNKLKDTPLVAANRSVSYTSFDAMELTDEELVVFVRRCVGGLPAPRGPFGHRGTLVDILVERLDDRGSQHTTVCSHGHVANDWITGRSSKASWFGPTAMWE